MAVGSGIPYNIHTGNGASTVFAYSFTLLEDADLVVTLDDVTTTAYTVSGVGNPAGGSVTFSVAPSNGVVVLLKREIDLVRETDYQNNGDLLAPTLNDDFDRLWMAVQQVGAEVDRSIRAPLGELFAELPAAADRSDLLPVFDGVGDVTVSPFTVDQLASTIEAAYSGMGTADAASYLPSGTGAVATSVQAKLRESVSVFDFMTAADVAAVLAGTSTVDSTPYVLLAANYAASKKLKLSMGGGTHLFKSTLALTSAHNGLTVDLAGATVKKAFNGDLCTLVATQYVSFVGAGIFDGDGLNYTGRGFVFTGIGGLSNHFGPGIITNSFESNHFYFGPDAGRKITCYANMNPYPGQVAPTYHVLVNGPDTGAGQRAFCGIIIGGINLIGAITTTVTCPQVNSITTDSATDIVSIAGASVSSNGGDIELNAGAMNITGCRISGNVVLSSTFTGVFLGNTQTSGTFTDNSIEGNALVYHHPLSAAYIWVNKTKLSVGQSQGEIVISQSNAMNDADFTWAPDDSPSLMRLAGNLTADRTVTLTTTGARSGMLVRFSRYGGDTGGPWKLTLGSTGVALWAKQWADCFYTGSAWVVTATGHTGADLRGLATYDPANLVDGAGATTTVTVTGAALGDFAEASFGIDLQGITLTSWVSAANTVSVRFQNETGGAIDLGSGTLRAIVRKV